MRTITSEGNTTKEAIDKGLKELNLRRDDVIVKVLEEENKKSFYSILDTRTVRVELTVTEEAEYREKMKNKKRPNTQTKLTDDQMKNAVSYANDIMTEFIKGLPYENVSFEVTPSRTSIDIELKGEDASKLIGYKGETLNNIQKLLIILARNNLGFYVPYSVDCDKYKADRAEKLVKMANKYKKQVIRSKRKMVLNPMNSFDRKIIHNELQNNDKVYTYSIGREPKRRLVIDLR